MATTVLSGMGCAGLVAIAAGVVRSVGHGGGMRVVTAAVVDVM